MQCHTRRNPIATKRLELLNFFRDLQPQSLVLQALFDMAAQLIQEL